MSAPPPICTGYLTKLGHLIKSWKKRYFILEMGRLKYYEKQSSDSSFLGIKQKGCMVLTNVQLQESEQENEKDSDIINQIYLIHIDSGKDLLLAADDYRDAQRWKEALREHILFATIHSDMAYTENDTIEDEKLKMRRASQALLLSNASVDSTSGLNNGLLSGPSNGLLPQENRLSNDKDSADLSLVSSQNLIGNDKITVKPTPGFVIKTRRESGMKVRFNPILFFHYISFQLIISII